MNKSKELVKNTIILFIGKFCTQFITLLLLPLYTYCLTTEDYGYIDLVQTYLTFLVPLVMLKMESGVFRYLIDARKDEESKSRIITSGLYVVLFQILISILIYVILINFIELKYNILIVGNLITLTILTFFLQVIRGIGNNKQYSISSILSAIITITCNCIFLLIFHKQGNYVLFSSLIANIGCLIFLIYTNRIGKYIKLKKYDRKTVKELLGFSIPMIPNEISWWIVNLSDRTIISYIIGVAANGLYSVSCKFSNILSSIFSIFNMSWMESAALHINDEDKDVFFSDVINKVLNLFVSICIGLIACIPILFKLIINDSYMEAYNYIPVLLVANIFYVLLNFVGVIYAAKKLTKKIAKTTIIAALINILINLLFIKKYQLYAAAFSTLIAYAILGIYRYIDTQKYVKARIKIKYIILNCLMLFVIITIYYIRNFKLNILGIILSIIYAYLLNRKLIKSGINMIIDKISKSRC